jgi:hypothetical protein
MLYKQAKQYLESQNFGGPMTTRSRIHSTILFVFIVTALAVSTVHASPQSEELLPNPAAESYLLSALQTDGYADLSEFPEGERNISGSALTNALKDSQVQANSFIYIANITVVDAVYANDLILPSNIQFSSVEFLADVDFNSSLLQAVTMFGSSFQGYVDFSYATFNGNINISDNTFQGFTNFGLATFNGNILIWSNTFGDLDFLRSTTNGNMGLSDNTINGGLNFYAAHVTGELLLERSKILGTEPMQSSSSPIDFWTTTVDGRASFASTNFAGKADFTQSSFFRLDMWNTVFEQSVQFNETIVEQSADFYKARFKQSADFTNFYTGNSAKFKGAQFNSDALFENAIFGRDVTFDDAHFDGIAKFDYIMVGRFCDFTNTTFKDEFSFYYTTTAWPYFDNATFNGPVNFEGMQASEDFEISNSSYNHLEQPFAVTLATIGGAVKFSNFNAPAGFDFSRSQFESLNINSNKELKTEFININESDIENELTINNINTKSFTAAGATIGKSTNLSKVSITEKLDMRNASIGFLKIDEQPQWPTDPAAFTLRGMTYTDIDIGDQGLTNKTFKSLLGLVDQSAYSPQSYQALSQFLMDKGRSDWASEVELAQKRRERNTILTSFSGAWFWSWFLDIFAGYGKRPVFAFGWSALVITIGAFVFRKDDMAPVEEGGSLEEYNPVWYSFALFLPYIDLGITEKWEPSLERKRARNYKYVHMMLGWILAPIALLTFSGIIG